MTSDSGDDRTFWTEDDLRGRFEVRLTVDVSTSDGVIAAAAYLREVGKHGPWLGYEMEAVSLIGGESGRVRE